MGSKLCQGVLLCVVLLGGGGCFLTHGETPPAPAPRVRDAAPGPRPVADAGVPSTPDAGTPAECFGRARPTRADRTCIELGGFDGTALPAHEPFDLPVAVDDGCFCAEQLLCEVSVRRGPGLGPAVIELATSICDDMLDCDGCVPQVEGTCRIPALPAGDYRVRINGVEAYPLTLPVSRSDTEEQVCLTAAPPAASAMVCPWQSTPVPTVVSLCVPSEVLADTSATVRVTDGCGGCFDQPADCVVTQQGRRLLVEARTRSCDCPSCGACAEMCARVETTCRLPRLPPGTYTVVSGALSTTLEVVPGIASGDPPAPSLCVVGAGEPSL